jgi:aryl-alcohol dehydrogenase-like predicted oxidoreductase
MQKRKLGNRGLEVSARGRMQMGGDKPTDKQEIRDV